MPRGPMAVPVAPPPDAAGMALVTDLLLLVVYLLFKLEQTRVLHSQAISLKSQDLLLLLKLLQLELTVSCSLTLTDL